MSVNTRMSDSFSKFWKSVLNLAEVIKKTPGILSYFVAWEKKDLKDIQKLNNKNFKFYVWETKKHEKDQFYSEEFYIWAIANLINLLEKGWILDIEVWADVSKIMNENWDSENDMTTEEQIEFIREIIRKNFKKFENRINLINTSKRHPELFNELEQNWLDWLEWDIVELELGDNFKSLDIAKLLYKACKKDEKFFNIIKWTRPEKIKESNLEKPKYYSLVEIAFRLTDYINWINIHGGERRQERYDIIIRWIINWDYNHIPTIKKIYNFLQTSQNLWTFNSLHFSEKSYEKEQQRIEKIKNIRNVIWAVSLSVLLILWWVSVWINIEKNKQKNELNKQIDLAVKELVSKMPNFYDYTDKNWWNKSWIKYDTLNKKLAFVYSKSEFLAKRFIDLYWKLDYEDLEFVKLLIITTLSNSEEIYNGKQELCYTSWDIKFLNEVFIPMNKPLLLVKWFKVNDILWNYSGYIKEINDTSNLSSWEYQNIEFDRMSILKIWSIQDYDLWVVTWKDIIINLSRLWKKINIPDYFWKSFIVAKSWHNSKYTIEDWIIVSKKLYNML